MQDWFSENTPKAKAQTGDDWFAANSPDFADVQSGSSTVDRGADTGPVAGVKRGLSNINPANILDVIRNAGSEIQPIKNVEQAQEATQQYQAGLKHMTEHPIGTAAGMIPIIGPALRSMVERAPTDPTGAAAEAVTTFGVPAALLKGGGMASNAAKERMPPPMELYNKAAANRQAASTPAAATGQLIRGVANTNIPDTASAAIKLAASPVRKGVAYLQEKMANSLMDSELARLKERHREPVANAPNTTKAPRQATATPYTGNAMEGRVIERPPEPPAKPDIREIERGIAPSGERAKRSTLRTAPKLAVEVPELAGLRPGPEFDKALVDGFKRTEMKIDLADNNVPPSTQVPRTPIIDEFKAIEADYKSRGLEAMESKVAKIREKWEALPEAIPWGTFVKMKRAFFKEGSITSAPMRRSYRAVMDASSKVSTELSDANYSYSVVRQALDDAKIDPTTGRRIMEVGKK